MYDLRPPVDATAKQQPVLGREALRERIRAWNRDKEHRVKLTIGCPPGKHIELLERLVAAEYDHQKAQERAVAPMMSAQNSARALAQMRCSHVVYP